MALLLTGCNRVASSLGDSDGTVETSETGTETRPDHGDPTCPPFSQPIALVQGLGNINRGLELDEDEVYFVDGWRVVAVAKAGGATRDAVVAASPIRGLDVDDTHVYWSELDGVFRAPKIGGEAQRLSEGSTAHLVLSGDEVFFSAYADDEIRSVPKEGGPVEVRLQAADVGVTSELVSYEGLVAFLATSTVPTGGLWEIDSSDDSSRVLFQPEHVIRDLHSDADHLYLGWEAGHQVQRIARAEGASVETVAATEGSAFAVATDDTRIFWTDDVLFEQAGGYVGRLMCMTRGETTPVHIADYPTLAATMRVDDSGIYWSVFGNDSEAPAVFKVPLAD